jgi:hypothetical protein
VSEQTGRCISCKYWKPFDAERDTLLTLIIRRNRLGLCSKIGDAKDRPEPPDEANWTYDDPELEPDGVLAMADDASGLQSMRTAAGFGCVLWEQKP